MDFEQLLVRLTAAVEARDGEAFADCFTPDGIYDDYFFGRRQGRQGLKEMLDHFYAGAENFRWEFLQPVCSGDCGYARYRFSFDSLQAQALGRRVAFDGISCVDLRDGRIAHYREVFDRGVALVQQNFAPEHIVAIERKHAEKMRRSPEWTAHFATQA